MKKIAMWVSALLIIGTTVGCQVTVEDTAPPEATLYVYNNSTDGTNWIYGVDIQPAGANYSLVNQMSGTLYTYSSAYIYGITDCDQSVDLYWEDDYGLWVAYSKYLPCNSTSELYISPNGAYTYYY